MRRVIRCAFSGLLALALLASGPMLALPHAAAHAHGTQVQPAKVPTAHAHHHAGHHADVVAPDKTRPAHDDASKTCCSLCVVASPLPPAPADAVLFEISRAVYANQPTFGIALTVPVDPRIPKRFG